MRISDWSSDVCSSDLIVLLLLLLWIAIGVLPLLPLRFWQLAGLCAIAAAVLWWFLVGAKRYSRRGFSSKRIGDLGPGNPDDEREPLAQMRAALAEAKGPVRSTPCIHIGRTSCSERRCRYGK